MSIMIPGDFGKKVTCPCCNNPWNMPEDYSREL